MVPNLFMTVKLLERRSNSDIHPVCLLSLKLHQSQPRSLFLIWSDLDY